MSNRMNVIYIHTHDSGKIFAPYYKNIPTPNYQDFCQDALLFDKAFSTSPTCSPSRCGLLTGQMPHNNGMIGLANRGFVLNDYSQHLVSILNNHGYNTVLCGIQHEYGRYTEHELGAKKIGYKYNLTSELLFEKESDYYKWDFENADNVCRFLSEYDDKQPFFVSYGMFLTHRHYPEVVSDFKVEDYYFPDWLECSREIKADYSGHLQSLIYFDECFGRVIKTLKQNNLYDNTIIVVTTDHGIAFPLAKCTLSDRGLGVNFCIRIPGNINNGRVYDHLFSQVDFLPTLMSLLKIDYEYSGVGLDFASVLTTDLGLLRNRVYGEVNFHTSYEPMRSIRSDKYLYIRYFDDYNYYNLSNIDDSITKKYYLDNCLLSGCKDMELFYDLEKDPGQLNNLINDKNYTDIVNDYRKELFNYMIDTDDFLLNPDFEWKKEWIVNYREAISPKEKKYI